jgi:hypothetical protein
MDCAALPGDPGLDEATNEQQARQRCSVSPSVVQWPHGAPACRSETPMDKGKPQKGGIPAGRRPSCGFLSPWPTPTLVAPPSLVTLPPKPPNILPFKPPNIAPVRHTSRRPLELLFCLTLHPASSQNDICFDTCPPQATLHSLAQPISLGLWPSKCLAKLGVWPGQGVGSTNRSISHAAGSLHCTHRIPSPTLRNCSDSYLYPSGDPTHSREIM